MMIAISIITLLVIAAILFVVWLRQKKGERANLLIILAVVFAIAGSMWIIICIHTLNTNNNTEISTQAQEVSGLGALPVVGNEEILTSADTTSDPRTPATFAGVREQYGTIYTWNDLVACVGSAEWYKSAVDDQSSYTGFSWADIEKWSNDPHAQLTIQVFDNNSNFTDDEAREIAAEIVGDDLAAQLPIVRHNDLIKLLVNTRSTGSESIEDFIDLRSMVRVSLSPVVYNDDGTVEGVSGNSGIFIDCLNIWFMTDLQTSATTNNGGGETGGNDNDKLSPKNPADDVVAPQGVTKQSAGNLTDGQQSASQKSSGQTSGNVTDNKVSSDTSADSTTTDTGNGVTVGGTSDNTNDDTKDGSATVYDSGGTNGNTEIAEP